MCKKNEIFQVIAITDDSAYSVGTYSTREKAEKYMKECKKNWLQHCWVYRYEISKTTIQ